jgi:hypothetical protein
MILLPHFPPFAEAYLAFVTWVTCVTRFSS